MPITQTSPYNLNPLQPRVLSRRAPKHLRTVNYKSYATNDDHEETQSQSSLSSAPPSEPGTPRLVAKAVEEDLTRSPDDIPDSDLEDVVEDKWVKPQPQRGGKGKNIRAPRGGGRGPNLYNLHTTGKGKSLDDKENESVRPNGASTTAASGNGSQSRKRAMEDDEETDMFSMMSSSSQSKRLKGSQQKYSSKGRAIFSRPPAVKSSQEERKRPTFVNVRGLSEDGPASRQEKPKFKDDGFRLSADSSSQLKQASFEPPADLDEGITSPDEIAPKTRASARNARPKVSAPRARRTKTPPKNERPQFNAPLSTQAYLPHFVQDDDDDAVDLMSLESSPLSAPPSSVVVALDHDTPDIALCPLCEEVVPRTLLEEYLPPNGRMRIKQQQNFHLAHRRRTAEETWSERGYPIISWDNLDVRLSQYDNTIEGFIDGKVDSYYRGLLEDKVNSGKNRTLNQMMNSGKGRSGFDGLTPGYYGSRGAKMMMEHIVREFAPKLRDLAGSDRLITAEGVSGYIQEVIVPELAVLLVKEDMSVDDEEARTILAESIEIGDLLNEEHEMTVRRPVEEEDVVEYGA